MITIFFDLLLMLLRLYGWAVFLAALISMLMSFGVLDSRNRFVSQVADALWRITEPALRPIRAVLPTFGGLDFSPWLLLIIIYYVLMPAALRIESAILFHSAQPLLY